MTSKMLTGSGYAGATIAFTTAIQFFPLGGAGFNTDFVGTEANALITARVAGIFSNAGIRVVNGASGTHTAGIRKNSAPGNLSISCTASTSGWFTDAVHTDAIVSGDTICGFIHTTASFSESWSTFSVQFSPTTGATVWYAWAAQSENLTFLSSTATVYIPPAGMSHNTGGTFGTETPAQVKVCAAGTLSRLQVLVKTNSNANAATVRTRKGGVNGGQSVSITAAGTGLFEDASGTDTIATTNLINYQVVTGASTVNMVLTLLSIQFTSSGTNQEIITGQTTSNGISNTVTTYWNIFGWPVSSTTEAPQKTKIPFACTLSFARVSVGTNSSSITETFKCRINGADGNQSATISASTSGIYEDATHSDSVTANDDVNYAISAGNSSSVTIQSMAMTLDGGGGGGGGGTVHPRSNSVVLG